MAMAFMDEPDLYDDILGGTLTPPPHLARVEALLEVGVHRRVLRLPPNCTRPLQAVREASGRLLDSDVGLRDAVGSAKLVFQRRSLKFDTWVDMEAVGERPVADGERLRALVLPLLEAGEVLSGEEKTMARDLHRRSTEKRRHKKRRRRSGSREERRRHKRRHRDDRGSRSRSASLVSLSDSEEERRKRRKEKRKRKERHRHSRRHRRRHRSRSVSSDSNPDRSRSRSSGRSSTSSSSGGDRRTSDSKRRRTSESDGSRLPRGTSPVVVSKPRVPPPREVSAQTWQHMDPEFAKQLREYELERARREGQEHLQKHLADLADISDGVLSSSESESAAVGNKGTLKTKDMSELGLRVLERLKKLKEEFGGGSADKTENESAKKTKIDEPEPTQSRGGAVYAAYLKLENKHPVMALNEYCTARLWEAPFFHLTEKPTDNKKQKLFTAAVRVNKKMYTMPELVTNKKDGRRGAALYCLQKLGVLKGGSGIYEPEEDDM